MDTSTKEHGLRLGDITRSWVDGQGIHWAVCDCGALLSGKDGSEVAAAYMAHAFDEE